MQERRIMEFNQLQTSQWKELQQDPITGNPTGAFYVSEGFGVFSGVVQVIDESGYCAVRSEVSGLDFLDAKGLILDLIGDGKSYFIDLRMLWPLGPFGFYAAFHTMPGVRQKIYLPFSEFEPSYLGETLSASPPLNPVQISSIGFLILDASEGDFELKIRFIGTYK